jgi:AcrR family transcriptional regulator
VTERAATDRGYHHGDLAEALMDAAIMEIAADGTENLSLRALARQCGVSATAPYRHFPSKRCLLAALATRGFRNIRSHCEAALADAGDTLEARVMALGRGYINFALENPTVYQLMFGSVLEDFSEYESLAEASEAAYALVLEVMEDVVSSVPGHQMSAIDAGAVAWAGVHGIASLLLFATSRAETSQPSRPKASLAALRGNTEGSLRMLMAGLLRGE